MPKKEESPLKVATNEGDTLKKQVNSFLNEGNKLLKAKKPPADADEKKKQLFERCKELNDHTGELIRKAKSLEEENEPSKVKNFENKKEAELKRLEGFHEQLKTIGLQLEPDDVEESYFKQIKEENEAVDEEEEEEEESEEDEEDEEEEDEEEGSEEEEEDEEEEESEAQSPPKPAPRPKVEVKDASSKNTKKGQVVEEEKEEDEEENEEGEEEEESEEEDDEEEEETEDDDDEEEEEEDEDDDEEDEDEEDEEDDSEKADGTMRQYEAIADFDGEGPDDLKLTKGEILTIITVRTDGWLEAVNHEGDRGLVPITYLKVYDKYPDVQQNDEEDDEEDEDEEEEQSPKTPRSGRMLWKNIKKAVHETSVTDVLHAMGAVPAGFRESTLAKYRKQDIYCLKNYLIPKLSTSCLSYRDLFYNEETEKIRSRTVRVQRVVSLVACRQIPLPGTGIEITSRHVRVCLFDGKNVLSNVHTIRISGMDKDQKNWNFNTKVTDSMKSIEFGEFFIRSNSSEGNLGILFEICMSYIRTNTNQESEFSCGWVHLPLYDANGAPTANKTYDLHVNGGTPYEKGVDVDPSVGRRDGKPASTSLFRTLMSGNRQPRLGVRLAAPTKEQKDYLDTLPDILVSSIAYIQYMSFYRQLLTDALLRDAIEPQSTELIHSPLLSSFADVADHSDLMDVLRTAWAEKLKTAKRAEKKDAESLKVLFSKVYMETVYPLYHSASIPPLKFADKENETVRIEEIQRLIKIGKDKKMSFASLLSPDAIHKPFDMSEVAFNVVGPYCINRQ